MVRGETRKGVFAERIAINPEDLLRDSTVVHTLAARKLIRDLEDGTSYMHAGKTAPTDDQIRDEIVRLGLTYNLASSHTSFVAVQQPGNPAPKAAQQSKSSQVVQQPRQAPPPQPQSQSRQQSQWQPMQTQSFQGSQTHGGFRGSTRSYQPTLSAAAPTRSCAPAVPAAYVAPPADFYYYDSRFLSGGPFKSAPRSMSHVSLFLFVFYCCTLHISLRLG